MAITLVLEPGAPGLGTYRDDGTLNWPPVDVYGRSFEPANAVVYRVSADQFAVVLPQDAHNVEAIQVAKLELGIGIDPDLPTEPLKRVEG